MLQRNLSLSSSCFSWNDEYISTRIHIITSHRKSICLFTTMKNFNLAYVFPVYLSLTAMDYTVHFEWIWLVANESERILKEDSNVPAVQNLVPWDPSDKPIISTIYNCSVASGNILNTDLQFRPGTSMNTYSFKLLLTVIAKNKKSFNFLHYWVKL
jgi:hypothetical protein